MLQANSASNVYSWPLTSILLVLLASYLGSQETYCNNRFLKYLRWILSYSGGPQIHGRVPKSIMKMGTRGPQNQFVTPVTTRSVAKPTVQLFFIGDYL